MTADTSQEASLHTKQSALIRALQSYESLAVAFSGGVDSALLLDVAHEVLGCNALALTAQSPSIPVREITRAREFCEQKGIRHVVVETHEFDIPGFDHNPPDRCYLCKREILGRLLEAAARAGVTALAEGSNLDDDSDYRPGARAVAELRVASPLREAGFTKQDVRDLARQRGLAVWNKPALACLNTRFAYGELITPARLALVDEAEEMVRAMGVEHVRVRMEGNSARIEVSPEDIPRLTDPAIHSQMIASLTQLGFAGVSLDPQGYRRGSMNKHAQTAE